MKQILVTGGTSGIGLATARQFKSMGHQVWITGRTQSHLDQALDSLNLPAADLSEPAVQGLLCDQSQPEQIKTLAEELTQEELKLDVLVLNAGIFLPQMFDEMTPDNLSEHMTINFTGPLLMAQALLPLMSNPSSLVYVSSIAAEKAFATAVAYSASKAAFEGAMGALNMELAPRGIRVNAVRPGVTLTDIQRKAGMDEAAIASLNEAMGQTPAGRMLAPEDISPAIAYLALESSRHCRNSKITVDGGYCL